MTEAHLMQTGWLGGGRADFLGIDILTPGFFFFLHRRALEPGTSVGRYSTGRFKLRLGRDRPSGSLEFGRPEASFFVPRILVRSKRSIIVVAISVRHLLGPRFN